MMNPMRFSLYIGGCLLSGAVWSGIAYAIGKGTVPEPILARALPWAPLWGQAIWSLFTLEVSALLSAMAIGKVKGDLAQNYYGVLYGLNLTLLRRVLKLKPHGARDP